MIKEPKEPEGQEEPGEQEELGEQGGPGEPEKPKEQEEPTKKKNVQERIDELTYKFREAEREAQYWKELAPKEEPPKPSKEGRPDQEKY
jgi:hypothetical protein